MIYQESRQTRRIVGRLDEGDDCVEALNDFCKEHDIDAAEVRAVGRLGAIEVVRYDEEAGEYRTVYEGEGDFDLLNLSGNVSRLGDEVVLRLAVMISAQGPVAPQVITGQLRSATAVEFEFVMDVFEDLELQRKLDRETGVLALNAIKKTEQAPAPEPAKSPEPTEAAAPSGGSTSTPEPTDETPDEPAASPSMEGQSMSWGDAAEASKEKSGTDKSEPAGKKKNGQQKDVESIYGDMDLDGPELDSGDILEHPKLGRCHVMKVEDQNYAHIRLPRGKIRKLSLKVVDVKFKGEEDGRNVFEAQVSR